MMAREVNRSSALLMPALLFCLAAAQSHAADRSALVERGAHIARTVCAYCHWVARDQEAPPRLRQHTPDFVEIANRPGTSEKSLRKFISTTHWDEKSTPVTMPTPMLTQNDVKAVARYILSLRARGTAGG